jgi:site-specific recombinase XerD
MTKISYTPVLKKKYPNDSIGIVNVRVTKDRKSVYFSTKLSLNQRFWNNNGVDINSKLREQKGFDNEYRNQILTSVISLLDDLKKRYRDTEQDVSVQKKQTSQSFNSHLLDFIHFLEERKKIGTSKRYKTTLYHIQKFLKNNGLTELSLSDFDSSFIERFETYLLNQGNKGNTVKNYINCIKRVYMRCYGRGLITETKDPFVDFKGSRVDVKKTFLQKKDVERIMNTQIEIDSPLYHTRNLFLFQIFSQGLRVSDLITLRFNKVYEGNITYIQFKTKKENTIYLTPTSMWILKDYIKSEQVSKIVNGKYRLGEYSLSLEEVKIQYKKVQQEVLKSELTLQEKIENKELNFWRKYLDDVNDKVFQRLSIFLHTFSKEHPNDFIFPLIKTNLFDNVEFDSNTLLTKKQYNHLQTLTTLYNRSLKKLQDLCGIEVVLTSHIPRHTYTNLMIEIGVDIYEISKSLGHHGLKTTERYVNLIKGKLENRNMDLGNQFVFI